MDGVLIAFAVSFGVVFVAELGDKSQLMALTFATRTGRCRCWPASRSRPPSCTPCRSRSARPRVGAAHRLDRTGRGRRVLRLRRVDAARRHADRRRAGQGRALHRLGGGRSVGGVLPRRAGRQDDARHDHPRHAVRLVRHVGGLDAGHGRRGRAGDRRRPPARPAPARAGRSSTVPSGLFFLFGVWLLVDAFAQLGRRLAGAGRRPALDHHLAGWIALGLGLAAVLLGVYGRHRMRRVGAVRRSGAPAGQPGVVGAGACSASPCCSGSARRCWSPRTSCSRSRCSTGRAGSRAGPRWCCSARRCCSRLSARG